MEMEMTKVGTKKLIKDLVGKAKMRAVHRILSSQSQVTEIELAEIKGWLDSSEAFEAKRAAERKKFTSEEYKHKCLLFKKYTYELLMLIDKYYPN
jgi:hypothetical protein